MPVKPMVLVVDDNDMMRKLLAAELAQDGAFFDVDTASTGAEGLEKAKQSHCSVVILDMILPDTDGLTFIQDLKAQRTSDLPSIIAITGASEMAFPDAMIEAPHRGLVSAVFRKPFDHAKLREAVRFCATV